MRPNFFVNTPDILHGHLVHGGPGAFSIRAVLASMLTPNWGVYSGFELYEHLPVREGSEEYLDSEKYQLRPRDYATALAEGRSLAPFIAKLNGIRGRTRRCTSCATCASTTCEATTSSRSASATRSPATPCWSCAPRTRMTCARRTVNVDLPALGMRWDSGFLVRDLLTGAEYQWGEHNYVRLDPHHQPAHVFEVVPALT